MSINVIPFDMKTFNADAPVPGIYSGMPIQFYHGEKMKHILSKSTLVKYRACPAGAKHDKRLM